jgi:hypothetical protein
MYIIPCFIYNIPNKKQKNQFIPLPIEEGDFLIRLLKTERTDHRLAEIEKRPRVKS